MNVDLIIRPTDAATSGGLEKLDQNNCDDFLSQNSCAKSDCK